MLDLQNDDWDMECVSLQKTTVLSGIKTNKRKHSGKIHKSRKEGSNGSRQEAFLQFRPENKNFNNSGEREGIKQRLRCRQRELCSSSEIDTICVTESRGLTSKLRSWSKKNKNSNDKFGEKNCPVKGFAHGSARNAASTSTCSEGSYSRRKHQKRRDYEQRSKIPVRYNETTIVYPKVNPVFVWVRQEDTRIVEVLCEDYDYKNRLKLKRTRTGWRAIPKTKRFADAITAKSATQKETCNKSIRPEKLRKHKPRKKTKEAVKPKMEDKLLTNDRITNECYAALIDEDLNAFKCLKSSKSFLEKSQSKLFTRDPKNCSRRSFSCSPQLRSLRADFFIRNPRKPAKSNSCDFSIMQTQGTFSCESNSDLGIFKPLDTQKKKMETDMFFAEIPVPNDLKIKRENNIPSYGAPGEPIEEKNLIAIDSVNENGDERNYSPSHVMDMTKHDSDFNDADCDELGQLLNAIPDLEFMREDELEEINEEDWSVPTDLTLSKASASPKPYGDYGAPVSLSLSPLVTVTSAVRPIAPLTAPLPEVTITPVPKSAPPNKSVLENLIPLTERVKSEADEVSKIAKKAPRQIRAGVCYSKKEPIEIRHTLLKKFLTKSCAARSVDCEKRIRKSNASNKEGNSRVRRSQREKFPDSENQSDPVSKLKRVLCDPLLAVPDPLLVPRARLPALIANPAREIPRLVMSNFEMSKAEIKSKPRALSTDSDILEVSLSNLYSLLSGDSGQSWTEARETVVRREKSMDALFGWKNHENEFMRTPLKKFKSLAPGYSGNPAALSQMLWFSYLNHFSMDSDHNIMSLMNSFFDGNFKGNHLVGASPLTSPPQIFQPSSLGVESNIKTLSIWQEGAVASQRIPPLILPKSDLLSTPFPSKCGNSIDQDLCETLEAVSEKEIGRGALNTYEKNCRKLCHHFDSSKTQRHDEHLKSINFFEKNQPVSHIPLKISEKFSDGPQHIPVAQIAFGGNRSPFIGNVSVVPPLDVTDQSDYYVKKTNCDLREVHGEKFDWTDGVALRLQQFNTEIYRTRNLSGKKEEESGCLPLSTAPKLKIRNLVDPNTPPPKLFKSNDSKSLPSAASVKDDLGEGAEDVHCNLWHPSFGSNHVRILEQGSFRSPWRWTTVTVNGE